MSNSLKSTLRALKNGFYDGKRRRLYGPGEFHKLAEARALSIYFEQFEIDCVFDIGANRGQYAQALREHARYKGNIISFEPLPAVHAELERNRQGDSRWHSENLALSDAKGTQQFHMMAGDQFSSFLKPSDDEYDALAGANTIASSVDVQTDRLTDVYRRWKEKLGFRNAFIKIDTQGYDHVVLASGKDILPECPGIQLEVAFKRLYEDSLNFADTLEMMDGYGFALSLIFPNNAGHFPVLVEQDAIFHNVAIAPR